MADTDLFPWADSPEFDRCMRAIERAVPLGPMDTIARRYVYWRLEQESPIWTVPDDPFKPEEWIKP